MIITQDDKESVEKLFPDLKYEEEKGEISGDFRFTARFLKKSKRYELLDPNQTYRKNRYLITDSYRIHINVSETVNPYREVKNTDGRILNLAEELQKPPSDLHVYSQPPSEINKVCLVGYFDEDSSISLVSFLCEVVLPFFYDQAFYERNRVWPRGGFSHGCLGILENYYEKIHQCRDVTEIKSLTQKCVALMEMLHSKGLDKRCWEKAREYLKKKKIKHHWKCLDHRCSHRFIDCHPKAFYGLRTLRSNIVKYDLKYLLK